MKHISDYLRELGLMKPEPAVEVVSQDALDLKAAYQLGWQNGYAWGELVGRRDALSDLLEQLRLHGKVVDDLDAGEIREAQVKSTH